MSKKAARYSKERRKITTGEEIYQPRTIKLIAKTQAQKQYINTIIANELIFCTGGAGTGKTYCATTLACKALEERKVDRVILTRPAVTAGENFGFLPGELKDKYAPYLEPFMDIFVEHFGQSHMEGMIASGKIVPKPLAYIRGKTLTNSFIIFDEAQNATEKQMKLFLTRLGEGNKVIVDGDIDQKDIKEESGLHCAIRKLKGIENVGFFHFNPEDCVRSKLVKDILQVW